MYETKLKGHDGIAVYKSLHFSADFIGNFPEVGGRMLMVVVIDGAIVNELTEVSCVLLRYFMMQRSRYALGYPFLIIIV